jgi:hypothetical protein
MKVLTKNESDAWLSERGLQPLRENRWWYESHTREKMPADAGSRNFLASYLADSFYERPSTAVLEVRNWSVWPSSDNPELFKEYRTSLGEKRPLIEAAFHVFMEAEETAFRNVLNLCLLFFYDVELLSPATGDRFFCSHDEFCCLDLQDFERMQFLKNWFGGRDRH